MLNHLWNWFFFVKFYLTYFVVLHVGETSWKYCQKGIEIVFFHQMRLKGRPQIVHCEPFLVQVVQMSLIAFTHFFRPIHRFAWKNLIWTILWIEFWVNNSESNIELNQFLAKFKHWIESDRVSVMAKSILRCRHVQDNWPKTVFLPSGFDSTKLSKR